MFSPRYCRNVLSSSKFLVRNGIDSMSLSRDSVIGVIRRVADVEAHTQREAEVVGARVMQLPR